MLKGRTAFTPRQKTFKPEMLRQGWEVAVEGLSSAKLSR